MLVKASPWRGRRVLITGHTGFKGSWLSLWLHRLGAEVTGFALPPPTDPSLFEQARVAELVRHVAGDVRDLATVEQVIQETRPDVVFHLAAQPLVRYSYDEPVETYATNVMGTVHVLDACRRAASVQAVVCVTSDKCYENREWDRAYRENDAMGGHDPYSSSKGAAEIVVSAYRRSYFQDGARVASARAGNVIGGGDWAQDRLVPDIIRALIAGQPPLIRSPQSVRPWQHVLDALGGYLLLAEKLLEGGDLYSSGWNFGPAETDTRPVAYVADQLLSAWGAKGWDSPAEPQRHEAVQLRLDSAKARAELGWLPVLSLDEALAQTAEWHKQVHGGADPREVTLREIGDYMDKAGSMIGQSQCA
jgi:CDP-glucose 4,6-dehydratase